MANLQVFRVISGQAGSCSLDGHPAEIEREGLDDGERQPGTYSDAGREENAELRASRTGLALLDGHNGQDGSGHAHLGTPSLNG
jgi:hypothetical protein